MIFPIIKSIISHSLKSTLLFFTFVFFFECSAQTDILGCIDSTACNYNLDATVDDGTCDFCSCSGGTWFETSEVEYGVEIEAIAEHSDGDLCGSPLYHHRRLRHAHETLRMQQSQFEPIGQIGIRHPRSWSSLLFGNVKSCD